TTKRKKINIEIRIEPKKRDIQLIKNKTVKVGKLLLNNIAKYFFYSIFAIFKRFSRPIIPIPPN
ncbi:hypothetical protein B0H22_107129, partial [Methanohalophilus euhalobius]